MNAPRHHRHERRSTYLDTSLPLKRKSQLIFGGKAETRESICVSHPNRDRYLTLLVRDHNSQFLGSGSERNASGIISLAWQRIRAFEVIEVVASTEPGYRCGEDAAALGLLGRVFTMNDDQTKDTQ